MRTLLAAAFAMVASDAAALSCLRPDIVSSYIRADEAEESVYLLRGTLTFDEALLPETDVLNQKQSPGAIPAQFEGFALSRDGFTIPYDREVTLQPVCFGPWCGGAASGEDAMIFAKAVGDNLLVGAAPCGGTVFYNVTEDMVDQAVACMNGDCSP